MDEIDLCDADFLIAVGDIQSQFIRIMPSGIKYNNRMGLIWSLIVL